MNPSVLRVIGPGFLNQVPTPTGCRRELVRFLVPTSSPKVPPKTPKAPRPKLFLSPRRREQLEKLREDAPWAKLRLFGFRV